MKFALSISSILLFIIGILLSFQYEVFSSNNADKNLDFTYSQEIEMTIENNRLLVTHHLRSLPNHEIMLNWPQQSENRSCGDSLNNCPRLSEDLLVLNASENDTEILTYELPIENKRINKQFYENIFTQLTNGTVKDTTIHITDLTKSGGTWITGIPLVGKKSMDRIDYMLFAGIGEVRDLFWQEELLSIVHKSDVMAIYSTKSLSNDLLNNIENTKVTSSRFIDIVLTDESPTNFSDSIVFVSTKSNDIAFELLKGRLKTTFSFESDLLIDIVASLMENKNGNGQKSQAMLTELNSHFSTSQKEDFIQKLWNYDGQEINAEVMDKLLMEVFLRKTSFFSKNTIAEVTKLYPLLFEESRPVTFNGTKLNNMEIVFKDGQTLYAVNPLLAELEYSTSIGKNGFYVDNGKRSFRFPEEELFYVLNNQRYNVRSEPIIKIVDEYYVEETMLIALFLVDISKGEKEISIVPMDGF